MAVPKSQRTTSRKEYYYFFKKLSIEILELLDMNFGISEMHYEPEWKINHYRERMLDSLSKISYYISRASAFYPKSEWEKRELLAIQTRAIEECYSLYDQLHFCAEIFFVKKLNIYTNLAEKVKQEAVLLKYWKKVTEKMDVTKDESLF